MCFVCKPPTGCVELMRKILFHLRFFWLYVCFAGKVVVVIFFCLLLLFTVMVLCGVKRRVSERVRARDRGGG